MHVPDPAGVPPQVFRAAMGHLTGGVCVVSAVRAGVLHAMTATALSSVSLSPPLVLVCVGHRARFHAAIIEAGRWAVSILSAEQTEIAEHFANSGRDLATQFDRVPHRVGPQSGGAVIDGSSAWLDCLTEAAYPAGDHTVVVGRVVAAGHAGGDDPGGLIHRLGRFGSTW